MLSILQVNFKNTELSTDEDYTAREYKVHVYTKDVPIDLQYISIRSINADFLESLLHPSPRRGGGLQTI
jgi:hypothetical protein